MFGATLPCANTLSVGNVCEQRIYPEDNHNDMSLADKGATSARFLYRHVITAPRVATALEGLTASTRGEAVTVSGVLKAGGAPAGGRRVFLRATDGWVVATTGPDGSFTAVVQAPDHGHATPVTVRYNGDFEGAGLLAENLGPTQGSVTASWGSA
jgi:hypothetical protein